MLWWVIGLWSTNWGWALVSLLLMLIPSSIYKKCFKLATEGESKLVYLWVKMIVPIIIAVLLVGSLFIVPALFS